MMRNTLYGIPGLSTWQVGFSFSFCAQLFFFFFAAFGYMCLNHQKKSAKIFFVVGGAKRTSRACA